MPVCSFLAQNAESFMLAVEAAARDQERRGDLASPTQVELFAKSATAVTSAKKVMTGTTLEAASNAAAHLSGLLGTIADSSSQRTVDSVERSISG
ncbi:hypothetical protein RRG08_004983 [Elysia crispata]|uniref:Uncharacterized protein n=1 Tax=Elysia crispata TaxID=231223 RepID=A0AAE0ZA89_9GAST|nr:hypothetical protein RRG08_004983 [Elysia crispata]